MKRFACLLYLSLALRADPPSHVYLTWQGDTATTLTVVFHSQGEMPGAAVSYDTRSHGGEPNGYAHRVQASPRRMEGVPGKWVHVAELTGLPPGEDIFFIAGHPDHGFSPERKAKTVPADATRFRFAQGGDFGTSAEVGPLLAAAASFEPNFAALGGDIAYANDSLANNHLWEDWLRLWCAHMVSPKGYTIPMVLAIGNHEVDGGWGKSPANARYYFTYFPQGFGEVAYGVKRFGKDLAFLCLDSDHTSPSDGAQKAWIEQTLRETAGLRFRMAMYHVPMFPSHRAGDARSLELRKHWLPLFDALALSCAWENHDHSFKRTHLLKGGKPDPDGIPYFGDGCWGRPVRPVNEQLDYLRKAAPLQHYWICDIFPDHFEARAADAQARVFDVYPENLPDAADAQAVFDGQKPAPKPTPSPTATPKAPTVQTRLEGGTTVFGVLLVIADAADDAEESLRTGAVNLASSDLELIRENDEQLVALRFPAIPIPPGARLRSAFLQFSADESSDGPCGLSIHTSPDAGPLRAENKNLSARPRGDAKVAWNPTAWTAGESGPSQRTPDLAPLLAERLGDPSWQAGQPLVFLIGGNGKRVATALPQKSAGTPAQLLLEWEE